ncbi:hypothetical protein FB567DRAFT_65370 [Paraphoma chrysanthemicola]|uniref:DUF7587 domain-containing protein n=1 Tax=Paraphoma chrysanthemicola TaxID=798071 RepID=A0A8K0VXK7_9PLEO|nr:hypothetical protein FB567DRAFT_65370 [Paraphoma chrysanthemicola]
MTLGNFLRAWTSVIGGGPHVNMNTTTAIVPHGFMSDPARKGSMVATNFYDMPEEKIYKMARGHYNNLKNINSAFISWAASLHMMFCYAKYLKAGTAHIAVMDTHAMGGEVMVWHVPQLLNRGNHKYLAFGRTRGSGYQAVSLKVLEERGLYRWFPEPATAPPLGLFGHSLQTKMFLEPTASLALDEIYSFETIGSLFHELAFPVVTALLCMPA